MRSQSVSADSATYNRRGRSRPGVVGEQGVEADPGFPVYGPEGLELHRAGGPTLAEAAERGGVSEGAGEREFGGDNLVAFDRFHVYDPAVAGGEVAEDAAAAEDARARRAGVLAAVEKGEMTAAEAADALKKL